LLKSHYNISIKMYQPFGVFLFKTLLFLKNVVKNVGWFEE